MSKTWAAAMLCLSLALTACGNNYNSDEVPDVAAEKLYDIAKANMATGDYSIAQRYLEALDSRYPFGELTDQVQLDLIYVYYKQRDAALAEATLNRFIRLNPTHQNMDYVLYMKGLINFQLRSDIIQDYIGLDRAEKDPTHYIEAFKIFRDLITTYPDSIYAGDARQRMLYINSELAKREYAIALYYYKREAFLSSIRHCQKILYTYRGSEQLEPALSLMARNYRRLKLDDAADNVERIYAATFNKHHEDKLKDQGFDPNSIDKEALGWEDRGPGLKEGLWIALTGWTDWIGLSDNIDPTEADDKIREEAFKRYEAEQALIGEGGFVNAEGKSKTESEYSVSNYNAQEAPAVNDGMPPQVNEQNTTEESAKAEATKSDADKTEAEKVDADKAEAEKVEAEKADADKAEAEKAAQ